MGQLVFQATLGGQVNLVGPNTASTFNLSVPATTSTLATTSGTETLTNKTLTAPTLTSPNITTALTLTGAAGTSGQVLTSAGTGAAPTWTSASATPGGSTTQLQYNNAGAFAGISGVTTDGTRMTASTTIGVGAATPSTSGAGITFPATQSASSDANTLDDYEEGTWTVTLAFGGGSTGIAYGGRTGTYVKVGSMVMARCAVDITSKGSSTGAATITGFPFTASGTFHTAVAVQLISWTGAGQCDIGMSGGTTGSFYGIANNNGAGYTALTNTDFSNSSQFYFTMVYSV
jgi:hypothetical protein